MNKSTIKSATAALGIMLAVLTASTSSASASIFICNHRSTQLIWTLTINDNPNCPGSWRQIGWFVVPGNLCISTIGVADVKGKSMWTFAQYDANNQFPASGNTWSEPFAGHNACFNTIQNLNCTSPGSCVTLPHTLTVGADHDQTFTYQ